MAHEKLLELLTSRGDLFRQFEEAASEMLLCPDDRIGALDERRSQLVYAISLLQEKIEWEIEGQPDEELLQSALRCEASPQDLAPPYLSVYELSMAVRTIAARVHEVDIQVVARIRQMQDGVLERIKDNNRGQESQAARFAAANQDTISFKSWDI